MQKLKKVLKAKGIIYDENDVMILMHGAEYDQCAKLVAVTEKYIITVWHSAVMDSMLRLYDRHTFAPIAEQYLYPDECSFFGNDKWGSYVCCGEEAI